MRTKTMKVWMGALAAVGLSAAVASATPTIWVSDGTTTRYVFDQAALDDAGGAGDLNVLEGGVLYSVSFGSWLVDVNLGLTKPLQGSAAAPSAHLTTTFLTTAAGTLDIWFSETDFGPYGESFLVTGGTSGQGASATATIEGWLGTDNQNLLGGGTDLIATVGPLSFPDSGTAGGAGTSADLFSAGIHTRIVATGAASGSVDADLTPVPEPATMVLLGSGLLGLAGFARRKKG